MRDGYAIDVLERVRSMLAALVAIAAGLMLIGGLTVKSTSRWTDMANGQSMGWTDGVKPWAVWAVLGALVILATVYLGMRNCWWFLAGVVSLPLFWLAGTMAHAYRNRLINADWRVIYDHQSIALGLYLVPVVAAFGAVCAGLLIAVSTWLHVKDRRFTSLPT